ncbi:MAG: PrgI family protein [Arcanobacterium sp.]
MALEVKVYREVTRFQPKVMFGMSWRQLAVTGVALPILVGVYAVCYMAGWEDLGAYLVALLAVPAVALGWVRPMGVPFEKYFGYIWRFHQATKQFSYSQEVEEEAHEAQKALGARAIARLEAGN